jgi:small subunit ribosomal protein S16
VAVKIRLKRMGKIRAPFYRVVVMDSRTKRDGRAIEEIGKYHPTEEPSVIDIDSERAQYWLSQGAQPTEAVEALFKVTGDWQKFKGEPGTEGTLKVREPKPSKKELYEAAIAAAGKAVDAKDTATTARRKAAAKKAEAETAAEAPAAPIDVEAAEDAAEAKVLAAAEAERTEKSEKGDAPASAGKPSGGEA